MGRGLSDTEQALSLQVTTRSNNDTFKQARKVFNELVGHDRINLKLFVANKLPDYKAVVVAGELLHESAFIYADKETAVQIILANEHARKLFESLAEHSPLLVKDFVYDISMMLSEKEHKHNTNEGMQANARLLHLSILQSKVLLSHKVDFDAFAEGSENIKLVYNTIEELEDDEEYFMDLIKRSTATSSNVEDNQELYAEIMGYKDIVGNAVSLLDAFHNPCTDRSWHNANRRAIQTAYALYQTTCKEPVFIHTPSKTVYQE